MGRKIPGKKHRGVKDPYQQQLNRISSIKDKINATPADLDDQPIPERLKNVIEWQQLVSVKKKRCIKRSGLVDSRKLEDKKEILRGMTRPDMPIPAFIQNKGESDRKFLKRVDLICEDVIRENKFNVKSDGDVEEETPISKKKQRQNIEELMNGTNNIKKKKKDGSEPALTKKEKIKQQLAIKKQAKLYKLKEKLDESNRFKDVVVFGDIVHAPPVLTIPKRNKTENTFDSKPGRRDLLLQKMLKPPSGGIYANKKQKQRDMPILNQQRLERNRIQAVEEYRNLKRTKATGSRNVT